MDSFPVALLADSAGVAPASAAFASVGSVAGGFAGAEGVALVVEPFAGTVAGVAGFGFGAETVFVFAGGAG